MTWTDDHLRHKFDVYKAKDAHPLPSYRQTYYMDADRIGADGEFIFVLRPETDESAYDALLRYAHVVEHRAPDLAADIRRELSRIRAANVT